MDICDQATRSLKSGDNYPYDADNDWRKSGSSPELPPVDYAHRAARGIIADLSDRRGIKHEFASVDEDIRKEIIYSLTNIIRVAYAEEHGKNKHIHNENKMYLYKISGGKQIYARYVCANNFNEAILKWKERESQVWGIKDVENIEDPRTIELFCEASKLVL